MVIFWCDLGQRKITLRPPESQASLQKIKGIGKETQMMDWKERNWCPGMVDVVF